MEKIMNINECGPLKMDRRACTNKCAHIYSTQKNIKSDQKSSLQMDVRQRSIELHCEKPNFTDFFVILLKKNKKYIDIFKKI